EVLIFDYRGYGLSEGSPEEAGLYQDARAAMDYLLKEREIEPQRIVIFGRSLGGALASRLAADHPVKGLILESAFTSAADMGAEIYPFYPARLLTRLNYPTRADLQRVRAPVLIIHSRDDEIVSFAHSQRLLEAAPGKSSFLELRGGHNDGFLVSREAYQAGLEGFLADLEDRAP
ncbi:MAG: alpha/beta hydrolase, partial [Candidatus Competibacteraceae bacterium]|nr:alpha/beta hydrolase [Candidatus Competibacteraceae bacterium]